MLRINGRATMMSDYSMLAIAVDIDEIFYHCVKAVERSGLFDPSTWRDDAPTRAEITAALRGDG
jgi:hypothetical protein